MEATAKPFVHISIDSVDTVVFDDGGSFDPDRHDHYATFGEARDAALSSVEILLDEADYDGEDHREELERMRALLEDAPSFESLDREPGYQWFLARLATARTAA